MCVAWICMKPKKILYVRPQNTLITGYFTVCLTLLCALLLLPHNLIAQQSVPFVQVNATNVAKLTLGLPLELYANTTGEVQRVEFFVNQSSISNAVAFGGGYRIAWVPSAAGAFTVVAQASSSSGVVSTSAPVQVAIGEMTSLQVEQTATNQLTFRFNPAAFMPTTVEWRTSLDSNVWTSVTKQLQLDGSGGLGHFSEWPDYFGFEERIRFEEIPTEEERFYRIRAKGM